MGPTLWTQCENVISVGSWSIPNIPFWWEISVTTFVGYRIYRTFLKVLHKSAMNLRLLYKIRFQKFITTTIYITFSLCIQHWKLSFNSHSTFNSYNHPMKQILPSQFYTQQKGSLTRQYIFPEIYKEWRRGTQFGRGESFREKVYFLSPRLSEILADEVPPSQGRNFFIISEMKGYFYKALKVLVQIDRTLILKL